MMTPSTERKLRKKCCVAILSMASFSVLCAEQSKESASPTLSFDNAIRTAQKNDPWLSGNLHQQKSN